MREVFCPVCRQYWWWNGRLLGVYQPVPTKLGRATCLECHNEAAFGRAEGDSKPWATLCKRQTEKAGQMAMEAYDED